MVQLVQEQQHCLNDHVKQEFSVSQSVLYFNMDFFLGKIHFGNSVTVSDCLPGIVFGFHHP